MPLDAFDQRRAEGAVEQCGLVLYEDARTLIYEQPDDRGAEVSDPLVHVVHDCHGVGDVLQPFASEEAEQEADGLAPREETQLVGVFDVHHLIADVVGGLD